MASNDKWDVSLFNDSQIIKQLRTYTDLFKHLSDWPDISVYADIFKKCQNKIIPVAQSTVIDKFEDQYEPRVYLKGELQTRTQNWHDFFNAIIWLKFPKTKKMLNTLHFTQAKQRKKGSNRSTLENRITQFDECGAIIITNNKKLLDLIKNHQWKELFIKNKKEFEENIKCVIFGHAIFEKSLNPYIGMTCHCLLLESHELLEDIKNEDFSNIDEKIMDIWKNKISKSPLKLNALPVLGIPGYWPEQNASFYENTEYFR
ncbi:MAG: DUF3025 domain-containing protein [Gammaproteobacteria bacterium]|nr:DUF3025 domain-containing protein [Gammaproteobacteria bacterium]